MISGKSFRSAEKQSSVTSEIENSIVRDSDSDVLETNEQTQEKQLVSMIKDKNVISFSKSVLFSSQSAFFFNKQLEIIRSFVSFSSQSVFFSSKSTE